MKKPTGGVAVGQEEERRIQTRQGDSDEDSHSHMETIVAAPLVRQTCPTVRKKTGRFFANMQTTTARKRVSLRAAGWGKLNRFFVSALLLHFEIGVDHIVIVLLFGLLRIGRGFSGSIPRGGLLCRLLGLGFVHRFAQFHRNLF